MRAHPLAIAPHASKSPLLPRRGLCVCAILTVSENERGGTPSRTTLERRPFSIGRSPTPYAWSTRAVSCPSMITKWALLFWARSPATFPCTSLTRGNLQLGHLFDAFGNSWVGLGRDRETTRSKFKNQRRLSPSVIVIASSSCGMSLGSRSPICFVSLARSEE